MNWAHYAVAGAILAAAMSNSFAQEEEVRSWFMKAGSYTPSSNDKRIDEDEAACVSVGVVSNRGDGLSAVFALNAVHISGEWIDADDGPVDMDILLTSITVSGVYRVQLGPIAPYLGGGGGVYYTNAGRDYDNGSSERSEDDDFGWHVLGGVEVSLSDTVSIVAEAQQFYVNTSDFGQLGGVTVSGGISVAF
jgi:opacity protein-like surface antigen